MKKSNIFEAYTSELLASYKKVNELHEKLRLQKRERKENTKSDFSKIKDLSFQVFFGILIPHIEVEPKENKSQTLKQTNKKPTLNSWFYTIFSSSIRALLRQVQEYIKAQIHRLNHYLQTIFTSITLLFGLCCSSLTIAFDAFASSRSTRIFSI